MRASGEWRTLLLLSVCYLLWGALTYYASEIGLWIALPLLVACITLHSSLTHELIHGHPFRQDWLNAVVGFPALGLFVPYLRFKTLHIEHHRDELLTHPGEDSESFYMYQAQYQDCCRLRRAIHRANNTLLGRMSLGTFMALGRFWYSELQLLLRGHGAVARAWAFHLLAMVPVFLWLRLMTDMSLWVYAGCATAGYSILTIRTFLEHRAHEDVKARTVVIEDRGLLSLLFLNNNYHSVHHAHPQMPWYEIPAAFRADRDGYLRDNGNYYFRSYGEVFARYFLKAKEPVVHPLIPGPSAGVEHPGMERA